MLTIPPQDLVSSPEVAASPHACSCKSAGAKPIIFAIGTIGIEFLSEARRDSIEQSMGGKSAYDWEALLTYLDANEAESASVTWTLNLDSTPIYVIQPIGPFASNAYKLLREFMRDQITGSSERASIPGTLVGSHALANGMTIPIVEPHQRGMFNWSSQALVRAVAGGADEESQVAVRNFIDRVYFEFSNLGVLPQERAINYAATNALGSAGIFEQAAKERLELDSIDVEASRVCRIDSECWDVKLIFYEPARQLESSRRVYRFTIDVSDVVPVLLGGIRTWSIR
jgi:cyanobactin maturation PatA/PatG family protease